MFYRVVKARPLADLFEKGGGDEVALTTETPFRCRSGHQSVSFRM